MTTVIGFIMCLVSQGDKGRYMTLLKVYKESNTHYYVRSDGEILNDKTINNTFSLTTIDKRVCRKITRYE